MCSLKDLDIQSRAAVALVEEWQTPHTIVREIWKLEDLLELLVCATDAAMGIRAKIANRNGTPAIEGELAYQLAPMTAYLLESLQRLKQAVDGAMHVVEMFESQGYSIENSSELRRRVSVLSDLISDIEAFTEALEWQELERLAIPSDRIRAVADDLKSAGQASA